MSQRSSRSPTPPPSGPPSFRARLSGANEVPPNDTRTRGDAKLEVDRYEQKITYRLEVHAKDPVGLLGAAGAHIHCAPEGVNGPVVAFLSGVITGGISGTFEIRATITGANITNPICGATIPELVTSMLAGRTYVNVHSLVRPGGEVRGQIVLDDEEDDD